MAHRVLEVGAAGAALAARAGDDLRGALDRALARVVAVPAVDHAGAPAHRPAGDRDVDLAAVIRAHPHLAIPEIGEHRFRARRGDTVGDAAAGAAAVEPEHQTRVLGRAAITHRVEAEGAVVALEQRGPRL